MTVTYGIHGSESVHWLGMSDKSFDEICRISNIKPEWKNWEFVIEQNIYKNTILKPLNMYCHHFGLLPEIKKNDENSIIIKYFNYSDIYIYHKKYIYYATEKSWMRQFYPISKIDNSVPDNLIKSRPFKFFIPWILDGNFDYNVIDGYYEDKIFIPKQSGSFEKNNNQMVKEANFINFYFKDFLKNNGYCIIERGTNIFSIIVYTKDLTDRIVDEYNKIYSNRE
jgi:hypothetical protein